MARKSRRTWALRLSVAGIAVLGFSGLGVWQWQQRLPAEVRTLKMVLTRLSHGNNLGSEPVAFMVGSGGYTAHLAQQRGLCKPEQCDAFAQLDPYRHYGNGWDELVRQGYALGDIQAWAASSGTVVIPRATFRAYGSHSGFLACTVAHELAHIKRNHIFEQSYHLNHRLRGLTEKERELESFNHSRQLELEADRDAATMLDRAGYPTRICQHELTFMHHSMGDGEITQPDSTHPGYEERLSAMRRHYDKLEKQPPTPQPSTTLRFSYSRSDNLLTVTPQPR